MKLFGYKLYDKKLNLRINKWTQIDSTTQIGSNALVAGFKDARVKIGKYCDIAENFRIRPRNHSICFANVQRRLNRETHNVNLSVFKGDVSIGNACWIGDNVTILPGVSVGNGCVIGAGAVVADDLPAYAVCVGVPAKVIKYRFSEDVCESLEDIKWWNWNHDKIMANSEFFNTDLTVISSSDLLEIIR